MAGIYVHVPFCSAKCAYCDFYSLARMDRVEQYVNSLRAEFSCRRQEIGEEKIETIYFGGGTPSKLSGEQLDSILSLIPCTASELTIEVNPEDVNEQAAGTWRDLGFNRVSMGVQSLVDNELKIIRRRHSSSEAIKALQILRNAGFENISCDLIYGLPEQTPASFEYSLRSLLSEGIEHLSAYILSYEPGTLLTRYLRDGRVNQADDDSIMQMYSVLCSLSSASGFEHYEISNFARPGFRSRHNSSYWNGTPYLGLGPGAHSLGADGIRRFNSSDLKAYCNDFRSTLCVEEENENERFNDTIMIRLRCAEGLDLSSLPRHEADKLMLKALKFPSDLLVLEGSRLYIPENNWLMADAVIRDLFFD